MPDDILTLREVAEHLKLSDKSIYRLAQRGELPGFKAGGSWRFSREDIDAWVARQKEAAQREVPRTRASGGQ